MLGKERLDVYIILEIACYVVAGITILKCCVCNQGCCFNSFDVGFF